MDSDYCYPPEPKKPRLAEPDVPTGDQITPAPIYTDNNSPSQPAPSTSRGAGAEEHIVPEYKRSRLHVPVDLCDFCKSLADPADTESFKLFCYLHHYEHPQVDGYYPMFELLHSDED